MKRTLKKMLLGIAALVMAFALAGCGCLPAAAGLAAGYEAITKSASKASADVTAAPTAAATEEPEATAVPTEEPTDSTASDTPTVYESTVEHSGVNYDEIVYEAPDTDVIAADMDALLADIEAGTGDITTYFEQYDTVMAEYQYAATQYSIAYVKYSHDVTDTYYSGENTRLESALNKLDLKLTDISMALIEAYPTETLDAWGQDYIDSVKANDELTSEEILPLMDQDTELTDQYDKLESTFTYTDSNGKSWTLDDIDALYYSDGYTAYSAKMAEYFAAFNEQAGAIFVKMVKVRTEIATTLGYDNYAEYRYACYGRDYTVEDAKNLHAWIKEYIVPAFYDQVFTSAYSDLTTADNKKFLLDAFKKKFIAAAADFSPMLEESVTYMFDHNLYDIENGENRIGTNYTTYFNDYKSPFIFITWEGSASNTGTLIHESGHYCHFYFDAHDGWGDSDSLDLDEVDSQALEMLMTKYYDSFYGDAADYQRLDLLGDALYAMVTGSMEDEFQIACYEHPEWTLEEMNDYYETLCSDYCMSLLYGYKGTYWAIIPHTFESPLYYISYCTSMLGAMQIWELSQTDYNAAREAYFKILMRDNYSEFRATIESAGLSDPFSEETIKGIADTVETYLETNY